MDDVQNFVWGEREREKLNYDSIRNFAMCLVGATHYFFLSEKRGTQWEGGWVVRVLCGEGCQVCARVS